MDWVFIELRSALNSANILKTKSALLQADGDIVDTDGISDVNLGVLPLSSYFVAIKHRNHLGAMTAEAVSFANTTTTVDFINRTPAQIYEAQSNYNAGERRSTSLGYALWEGDASKDGLIIYSGANNDVNYVFAKVFNAPGNVFQSNSYIVKGYNVEDVNLDQQVIYQGSNNEVGYIQNSVLSHPLNVFASNNFYITEQLPANSITQASASTLSALQTIDYKYHIRGGLLGMNLNAANLPIPNAQESDLFSYRLEYETAGQWDGNIGKQLWANPQNQVRSYTFTYDYAKRLKSAVYAGINSENYGMPSITYDKNGNITTLQRNGKVGAGFALMDNLTYSYAGNRLQRVEDAISGDNTVDFVNRNGGTNDYDYYTDGSLKKDLNKEITQIDYDAFLKLPKLITLTNNRWIKITYAANGQVLKRTYSSGEFWEYDGGLVYKNGLPYQLSTPEGRATYTSNVWNYEYVIKDHLGNTRISFKANGTNPQLIDNTDFDPFGIELNGTGVNNPVENRFKYQNKETLALFGLNGINDFGARFFDKTIGRWWGVDPLADISRRFSPYTYANNNPLRFIDPDGMEAQSIQDFNGRWHQVGDDEKTSIYQSAAEDVERKDDFIFNENGNYVRTEKNNSPHRLVVEDSQTKSRNSYEFADPVNDPLQISIGIIRRLISVSLPEIKEIIDGQGGFNPDNGDILSFALEGMGGGKFDYTYSVLKSSFKGVSKDPTNIASSVIFLPQGDFTVHNASNFGNFLLGATAHALGFGFTGTQMGAHLNSLLGSRRNGYSPQFDSADDQRSISLGIYYSIKNNFRKITEQNK